jgi:hypothetical protein
MSFRSRTIGSIFVFKASSPPADEPTDVLWAGYVADALVSSWNTDMLPRYSNQVTGTTARVYPLGHPLSPASVSTTAAAGGNSGNIAPAASAAVIKHLVHRRGRGSQSHTQISPLQEAETDGTGDFVTGAFVTNVTTDFGNFIGAVQAAWAVNVPTIGLQYVQLSRKGAGATYPIVSSAVSPFLGTERSRTARP